MTLKKYFRFYIVSDAISEVKSHLDLYFLKFILSLKVWGEGSWSVWEEASSPPLTR